MKQNGVFTDRDGTYSWRYNDTSVKKYKRWKEAAEAYIAEVGKEPRYEEFLRRKSFDECCKELGLKKP